MQSQDMFPKNEEWDDKSRTSYGSNYLQGSITSDKAQPQQKFGVLHRLSFILAVLSLLITIFAGISVGWNMNNVGFFISIPYILIVNFVFYYAVRTLSQRIKKGKVSLFVGSMFFSALLLIVLTPKYSVGPGIFVAILGLWIGAILLNTLIFNIVRIRHKNVERF